MISVIMPTHNKSMYLNFTLLAYRNQTSKNFEIVLVDDGSTDNTRNVYEENKEFLNITYLYQTKGNAAKARNVGLAHAKGDMIVFADDDRIPCEEYILTIEKTLKGRKKSVLIGYKEEILTVYQRFINLQDSVEAVARRKLCCKKEDKIECGEVLIDENDILNNFSDTMKNMFLKVPYDNYMFVTDKLGNEMKGFRLGWAMATTANIAFCREGAEKIFFDENYVGWGVEDIDFAYQLKEAGFSFFFCKEAIKYHQKHLTNSKKWETFKRNMTYFCIKYPNLDVFFYYQSFQSRDKSFDYLKGNEMLMEIEEQKDDSIVRCFVNHMFHLWKEQQSGIFEQYKGEINESNCCK